MNDLGDWLVPALAAIWLLTRVLPRLFKSRPDRSFEPPQKEPEAKTTWSPSSSGGKGEAEPPPPIEPR